MGTKGSAALRLLLAAGVAIYLFHDRAAATPAATTAPPPPQNTTYAIARKSGRPYRCAYSWASFMGTRDNFTADIQGDDFITVPLAWTPKFDGKGRPTELPPFASWINFARKGSVGYTWPCNLLDVPNVEGCRCDLPRFKAETGMTFDNALFFAAPTDDASCERIESATIAIPPMMFGDTTQMFIEMFREGQDKTPHRP